MNNFEGKIVIVVSIAGGGKGKQIELMQKNDSITR